MMNDFNYYAPTRVVFGRESEARLPELIKQYGGTKVLIHYGGGSARRYGLLDRVEQMLHEADIDFVELGGVVPNPLLSKVKEGIGVADRSSTRRRPSPTAYPTRATCGTSGTERLCLRHRCP